MLTKDRFSLTDCEKVITDGQTSTMDCEKVLTSGHPVLTDCKKPLTGGLYRHRQYSVNTRHQTQLYQGCNLRLAFDSLTVADHALVHSLMLTNNDLGRIVDTPFGPAKSRQRVTLPAQSVNIIKVKME